ncbi:MAG: hypothetical protein FRX49_12338 [Trebouxia sp. A1-2]|nr:MAG: hypothetical protein FRX49_12338 [Trebouxia sp. A1-2]
MYCQQKRKAAPSDIMVAYTIFEQPASPLPGSEAGREAASRGWGQMPRKGWAPERAPAPAQLPEQLHGFRPATDAD